MKHTHQYVGPQGKIALPLIVLTALCLCDQLVNAVDYERLSWLACEALSFPLGWIAKSIAESLTESIAAGHEMAIVFIAACVGSVLNIYLLAYCITFLRRRSRRRQHDTFR
jgi:hypothetical protein